VNPQAPIEVRWHGRGGQGVVTASRILASAALNSGFYMQSLPDFGAERSGAPISAYTRIDNEPPIDRGPVYEPDVVIVLDSSLIGQVDFSSGLSQSGTLILNSPLDPDPDGLGNASSIGMELLNRNLPNTPILGAFAQVVPVMELESIDKALIELMSETFPPPIIEANLKALKAGFNQVKVLEVIANG
jgi:pyruvate ferredoxin oxidoreductase gamma subunit